MIPKHPYLRQEEAECIAGKYVSPSSTVHAGFEKFCIPTDDHGKTEFSGAKAVFINRGAPTLPR
jgi:hypothetical protein